MNNIKFNDWQEMALKKDTETIIKKMSTQEPIIYSLCWEIVVAVGAIIIDHLFDTETINIRIWIICAVIAIMPPVLIIVWKTVRWLILIKNVKTGTYSVKHFIDSFDNQICYWVMMCNSYNHLLANLAEDKKSEKIFLYQEGCYYNNKSIHALYKMKPAMDKVFTKEAKTVVDCSLVATYRLESIVEMIACFSSELDKNIESLKSEPLVEHQMDINREMQEQLKVFVKEANEVLSLSMSWEKKPQ